MNSKYRSVAARLERVESKQGGVRVFHVLASEADKFKPPDDNFKGLTVIIKTVYEDPPPHIASRT
jgi:hypothetical protein